MIRQYYAPRAYGGHNPRRVGTVPIGTILYVQDRVRPFTGVGGPIIRNTPWIVEAWTPREVLGWNNAAKRYETHYARGGHLARVRSLRDRRQVKYVADWLLLACVDHGGLEWHLTSLTRRKGRQRHAWKLPHMRTRPKDRRRRLPLPLVKAGAA